MYVCSLFFQPLDSILSFEIPWSNLLSRKLHIYIAAVKY